MKRSYEPLYLRQSDQASDHALSNDLDAGLNDLGERARPGAGVLSHRIEIRRAHADDGSEYLAILIRKPLTTSEIARIEQFTREIDPSSRWIHKAGNRG
jgi:hypothetical protein